MPNPIQTSATLFALLACSVVALYAIEETVRAICEHIKDVRHQKAEYEQGWRYHNRITLLDRYCCWHFPIVEDVCAYLLADNERVEEFRERMKAKYGDREKA